MIDSTRRLCWLALILFCMPGVLAGEERKRFGDELSAMQYGRSSAIDVLHYRLDLTFEPEERRVGGTTSVSLTPRHDGLSVVELDAGPMEIARVTLDRVEETRELTFRHDGEQLRIELPGEFAAGETITLNIEHSARPRAGLYFVLPDEAYPDRPAQIWSQGEAEDNHLWFPSFDYPNDRATTEEIYTVPESWTAVGNGELLEVTANPAQGTRSFHYRMDTPHVVYLVSIVAGELEKYEDEFDGIPVEYYVPVGTGREKTLRAFEPTPEMLAFFSERTGVRYPYAKYSQACAVDFIFGGMENISATTQTAETLRDAWAQLEGDSYGLVAHEAAHQWYGDLLTCASWSHAWLNEGFATYWEKLWWEHAEGEEEFLYRMLGARDSYLEEDRNEYRRPIVQRSFSAPFDIFDSHLYPKGAWVLHMIRGVLGDEAFFKAVQHYTRKHQGQVVETIDLRRAIQEATGVNLERFFDQWLHHGGHPEFRVTRDWDPEQRILTLRIEQQQTVDDLTPLFTLPIRLIVETDAGNVERRVAIERASQDVTLQLESAPTLVRFDPDFQVLYELEMERSTGETLHALRKDPGIIGRIFAARDLAKSASADEAVAGLELAVRHDIQRGVRIEAAKALGALRGDAARDALVAALVDHDARVRKAVARALGEFRDDDVAARELRALLDTERAYGVYAAAVLSLARIRAETAHDEARRALTLDSYQEQIRSAALEALAELDSDDARETLVAWSAYGRPSRARRTAVGALPRLGLQGRERDDVIRGLIDLLDDPDLFVRQQVMKTLAKLGADSAVDRLERSARSEADSRLRREARSALRSIRQGRPGDRTVDELAAEVERLREEIRSQSDRIEEIEKQAP